MAQERKQKPSLTSASGTGSLNTVCLPDETSQTETPRDFMSRCGADILVHDAVIALLQARPKDPIGFLSDYFGVFLEPRNILLAAYEKIRMTHYTNSMFEGNLVEAYNRFKEKNKKSGIQTSLQGELHNELLVMLTQNMPVRYSEPLLKRLMKFEKQSISFTLFRSDVTTVLRCEDFVNTALSIYKDIDFTGAGNAPRELCNAFLNELELILDKGAANSTIDKKLARILPKYSLHDHSDNKNSMPLDNFIESALKIFLRCT